MVNDKWLMVNGIRHNKVNYKFIYILLSVSLFAYSCKSKKHLTKTTPVAQNDTAAKVKTPDSNPAKSETYQFKTIDWSTFTAKVDIDVNTSAVSLPISNFSGILRMKKGEYVWLSVSVPFLGEQARVLITKDSIKVLNKFNKCYILADYAYIQKFSNVPFSLEKLQAALIGNPTVDLSSAIFIKDSIGVTANVEDNATKNTIKALLNTLEIFENAVEDKIKKQDLRINYSNFNMIESTKIPYSLEFNTVHPQQASIKFDYDEPILNKTLSPDFNIPASYTNCSNK